MFTAMEKYNTLTENPEADLQPVFVTYVDENIWCKTLDGRKNM